VKQDSVLGLLVMARTVGPRPFAFVAKPAAGRAKKKKFEIVRKRRIGRYSQTGHTNRSRSPADDIVTHVPSPAFKA